MGRAASRRALSVPGSMAWINDLVHSNIRMIERLHFVRQLCPVSTPAGATA